MIIPLLRALFDPLPGDRRYLRRIGFVGPISRVPVITRSGRIYQVCRPGAGISLRNVVNGGDDVFNNDDRVVISA